ncbi:MULTISPECIES: AAA family ATPase [unclassified Methylobacterium]|uniref:AAA family ATPase n=1 Tax=unclassified Methylobacterium TaxID=2615210 RepID=UPI001FF02B75|nr:MULTISPECIES: AAA family ATPase [unclassified Methylobacterium]
MLSLFPRRLRTCLDTGLRIPAARRTLVLDIDALVPEAAPLARAWSTSADADLLQGDLSSVLARQELTRFLDHHAAARDRPAARTLADVVASLSCTVDDTDAGARLALPLWLEFEALPDLSLQLPAIAQVQTTIGLGPERDQEDDDGDLLGGPDARQMLLNSWNEALSEALLILKGSASNAIAAAAVLSRGGACPFMTGALLVPGLCRFGERLTQSVADSAELAERRRRHVAEKALKRSEGLVRELKTAPAVSPRHPVRPAEAAPQSVPEDHVLIVAEVKEVGSDRTKAVTRGYEGVIGRPVPLAPVPDLAKVRTALAFEFPHAVELIDRLLVDLLGRRTVGFRPTLFVGPPGTGKSRLASRLAHHLAVGLWRVDATRDGCASIGGTDRRWATSEPAHPLMAITRFGIANPIVLVDEIEKSATRTDHGRLWDSLLPLLEAETASRYPDPAFQAEVNLAHVSWIATANATDPLPGPLRDRLRVLEMPVPQI